MKPLRWWLALIAAALGGVLLDGAGPGLAWWPLAFPAVALMLAGLWQRSWKSGLLVGAVAGAAFWLPHISWLTLYLGPVPWLALSALMIVWFALFGVVVAIATSGLAALPVLAARPLALVFAQAVTVTGVWLAREQVQGSWPYGGFPWGRVAYTQANGPLVQSASWIGFTGVTIACVLIAALVVAGAFARGDVGLRSHLLLRGIPVATALVLFGGLALVPAAALTQTGTLKVAAVQGNSKAAIFDDRESGDVLRDHIAGTERLLDDLERTDASVDLIVWPENSAEFGLPRNFAASAKIAALSRRADAPIVVGSILRNVDGTFSNSSLVWDADGSTGARYDKRFPVPFAEYMPNRDFFHALAPDLVDLVQLDYSAGTLPTVFDIATSVGTVRAGLAICFDIIFDSQATAMVGDDAQLILAQTNNADFGRTDESAQQLAIARLRAVETGRALVNISTVGTSAIVAPDGSDLAGIPVYTADAMIAEVPLVTGKTPALVIGGPLTAAWLLAGIGGLAAGIAGFVLARRSNGSDQSVEPLRARNS